MAIATDYTTDTLSATGGTITIAGNTSVTGNVSTTGAINGTNLNLSGSVNSATIRVTFWPGNNDYVLTTSDSGRTIFFNNNNPTFVNVSPNLPLGFRTILTSVNTGPVTIRSATANVVIHPRIGTQNQITGTWASASLVCHNVNSFILDGSIQ